MTKRSKTELSFVLFQSQLCRFQRWHTCPEAEPESHGREEWAGTAAGPCSLDRPHYGSSLNLNEDKSHGFNMLLITSNHWISLVI